MNVACGRFNAARQWGDARTGNGSIEAHRTAALPVCP